VITFAVMLVCALAISTLTARVREEAAATREREVGTAALLPMSGELLAALDAPGVVNVIARHVREVFGADVLVVWRDHGGVLAPLPGAAPAFALDDREQAVARWAFDMWQAAGVGTEHSPDALALYLPLVGTAGRLGVLAIRPDDPDRLRAGAVQWLLRTLAGQAALALERVQRAHPAP
jgi:two-component system sensor histidine kinase KdpD